MKNNRTPQKNKFETIVAVLGKQGSPLKAGLLLQRK